LTKQKIILCDIDGTVADISHRLHFIDDEIRIGDIVYLKNWPFSKNNPGLVRVIIKADDGKLFYEVAFKAPIHMITNQLGEALLLKDYLRKQKSNWKAFFEACPNDAPLVKNVQLVNVLSLSYPVVFMSGRPEDYRSTTIQWLRKNCLGGMYRKPEDTNNEASITELYMRPSGDTREDYIVKEELYHKYIEPYFDSVVVLDDRTQVVNMWRKLGLNCWQVANGNF
jgi:hypothetical protein